jgi:hypothetical protein
MRRAVLWSAVFLAISGCATTFYGAPKVPNGPAGCKAKCSSWGMELSGMVAMGDYSDGCICQTPAAQQRSANAGVPAASASIAGVWTQMEEAQHEQAVRATQIPQG